MRRRATTKQVVISLIVLAAVTAAGFWWWPHILWSFLIARNQVRIPRVPVTEMKSPGKTGGWYECRIGPLSLKMPPELAESADRALGKASIDFTDSDMEMAIAVPFRNPPESQTGAQQMAAMFHMSPLRIIAESYCTSSDDFRWTMSKAELIRHQILLNMGRNYPHALASAVETRYDDAIEGLLIIGDRRHVVFEWRTTSGSADGSIRLTRKDHDLDMEIVRDMCQSVTCDESQLGPPYTKKELKQFLDTIKTTRSEGDVETHDDQP
jgi:hypothetical protein